MRILLTVDPEIPVPPVLYGGIERIVDGLINEYAKLGHDVLLLANRESTNPNVAVKEGWTGESSVSLKDTFANARQLRSFVRRHNPDIIHSFSRLLYLYPTFLTTRTPVVQSYQREISPFSTSVAAFIGGTKIKFASCAAYMHRKLPTLTKWSAIYNFADTEYYSLEPPDFPEYVAFLGRIEEIKGTREAIEAASMANVKLVVAGNIPAGKEAYFQAHVQPFLERGKVEYIGPVDNEQKKALLQRAKGFLFPILWEEPFGIVMAESMACGVPVIGFKRGSVPEVVEDGVTGFIVKDVPEMAEAILKLDLLSREEVRNVAKRRFSQEAIAKEYIELYTRLIAEVNRFGTAGNPPVSES